MMQFTLWKTFLGLLKNIGKQVFLSFTILYISSISLSTNGLAKEVVIERTFSVSKVNIPKQCELDEFKSICTRLVNYYARRFEREMVLAINDKISNSEEFGLENSRKLIKAMQEINMHLVASDDAPIFTLYSIFEQKFNDDQNLLVETINFEAGTGKLIQFKDLFDKPELAAMICARAIEARYRQYKSPLLQIVISATELSPSNFIITHNGLRFFFGPGLVEPNTKQAQSMLITLGELKRALPLSKWWTGKPRKITQEEKDALARSQLSSIINLDEDLANIEQFREAAEKNQQQTAKNEAVINKIDVAKEAVATSGADHKVLQELAQDAETSFKQNAHQSNQSSINNSAQSKTQSPSVVNKLKSSGGKKKLKKHDKNQVTEEELKKFLD